MKIEITYNNGEKFTAYLADETYENVMACLVDDVSVSVMHSMGKAEEGEARRETTTESCSALTILDGITTASTRDGGNGKQINSTQRKPHGKSGENR